MDRFNERKILIVDDEPVITNTLSRFLLARGFSKVESINEPHQASAAIDDFQPDLILLDIMMPEIDGLDLLRRLCRRIHDKSIAVIMVTALDDEKTRRQALALGACDFINKPVGAQDLIERVKYALDERERKALM